GVAKGGSAPGRPLAGEEALSDPPLDVVGEASAGVLEIARDFDLGLVLVRVEDALEETLPEADAPRRALRGRAAAGGRLRLQVRATRRRWDHHFTPARN